MNSVLKWIEKLETALVTVTLIGMTIAVFLQVFFRTLGNLDFTLEDWGMSPDGFIRAITGWIYMTSLNVLTWSEEVARYFMVWTVFIGAAMGARHGVHVGIEAVVNLFPARLTRVMYLLAGFISLVFSLLVCFYGSVVVKNIAASGQISPALEIPMTWVYAAAPVGGLLMAVHFLQAAIEKYINFKPQKEC
ncbi:TRAP transporter small permease [Deltaproteobacteria bacterium OttesenSCG-928-K17]|nr:TRAP transporter small permease [Deltaproteobacteria bacterium OttesenSCG-928-K17]